MRFPLLILKSLDHKDLKQIPTVHNSPGTELQAEMVSVVARKLRKERREQGRFVTQNERTEEEQFILEVYV